MEKINLTQQKHTFTNQKKRTTTQNKHKKTKARFSCLTSYDIWPGNEDGLFWFRRFINLLHGYLLTYITYPLTALDAHAAISAGSVTSLVRQQKRNSKHRENQPLTSSFH